MLDPRDLYTRQDPATPADGTGSDPDEGSAPVLLHALTGFVDAGQAGRLARDHLLETLEHRPLVTFDVDQLLDYRSRRPAMIFEADHWVSYDDPRLVLHEVRDGAGTRFLLLEGAEPDIAWERFISRGHRPGRRARRAADHRRARHPDGRPAHPAHLGHRARDPAGAGGRPRPVDRHRPGARQRHQPARAPARPRRVTTRWGSRCTCRTTWRRPSTRPRPPPCWTTSRRPPTWCCRRRRCTPPPSAPARSSTSRSAPPPRWPASWRRSRSSTTRTWRAAARSPATRDLLAGRRGFPTADELGAELERFLADHSKGGDQPEA